MHETNHPLTRPRRRLDAAAIMAVIGLAVLLAAGCKTNDKPESAQFASVDIRGRPVDLIRSATADVFHEHGYKAESESLATLVFDKEGSAMNNLAYGNWMGTPVGTRVRLNFVPIGEYSFRIECHAFIVRNKGEVLEDEITINGIHRGQYQKMLDEIAKRLVRP
jgi:hypothetical protein